MTDIFLLEIHQSTDWHSNVIARYSRCGDPFGEDWVPAECDVSIRPGWFWHASEKPKNATTLLDIYYKSVGRNCLLILNVPPIHQGSFLTKIRKSFRNLPRFGGKFSLRILL